MTPLNTPPREHIKFQTGKYAGCTAKVVSHTAVMANVIIFKEGQKEIRTRVPVQSYKRQTKDLNPLQALHHLIIDEMDEQIVELINNLCANLQSLGYDEEVIHGLIRDRIKVNTASLPAVDS